MKIGIIILSLLLTLTIGTIIYLLYKSPPISKKELEERKKQLDNLQFGLQNINTLIEESRVALTLLQQQESEAQERKDKISSELSKAETEFAIYTKEKEELISTLEDWKAKRNAINQDRIREREKNEKYDFYRVALTVNDLEDLKILNEIKTKIHNRSNVDKIIYDNYVARPALAMVKRVLEGRSPSGIYKITRLKTGEVYIGKSTDVKNRWQEHIKTAYGVGSIAHSMLHTTMEKDGVENFSFELLEECSKDKLTEREKFYINLYDSKSYGMNEKVG